jgi:hypothetical protein
MNHEKNNAGMWAVAVAGALLFAAQTALADSDTLVLRLVIDLVGTVAAAAIVSGFPWRGGREAGRMPPDPISLALAALAVLSLWVVTWWLMAVIDEGLVTLAGSRPVPRLLVEMRDSLAGIDLQPMSYELLVLFAVVLLPLAHAWLFWVVLQPELRRAVGDRRAQWIAGGLAGIFLSLTAVQNVTSAPPQGLVSVDGELAILQDVAPMLPWGLASLGGYLLVGLLATTAVGWTGSAWAGFTVLATYAYANLALRDDLAREFAARELWDVAWLTVVVLGLFGTVAIMQVLRYRESPPGTPKPGSGSEAARFWLPLALTAAALAALAVFDLDARL